MSQMKKESQSLLNQNDCSDFELTENNDQQQQKNKNFYASEAKSKLKVFNHDDDDEYAYQESQHIRLIGDLSTTDQQMISTNNWKDSVRKQYGVQKCQEFTDPSELNNRFKLFISIKNKYIQIIPIIDPQNEFLTYWKIPVLIITIMIFVEIPLIIFFSDDFYETFRNPYYKFYRTQSILVYAIDMFIEFHVAFKHHGILVKNRRRVADHYFKGRFIFDFIPISVLIITSFSLYLANIYDLYLLFLLKVYPAYKINQRFVDKLVVYPAWKSFYLITRMVIELVYLTHFFGCIFFGTAVYMLKKAEIEGEHVNSWLTFNTGNFGVIERYDWTKRYILSTYWAFATLTTVAYGDITPMNEFEIIVSEVAMVAALFLVALNVANIQQTFIDYYEDKRKYQKEIIAITKFMRYKQISKETEQEIKNYLDHYFREKLNRDTELEEQVIQKLAKTLKTKLLFESYQKYLFSVPWIRCNFSEDVIKALCQGFEEIDYSAKENIFLDKGFDNQDDSSLYFVQVGHIELFIDVPETGRAEVIVAHLKQGSHFGDYGFITGMQRRASARSKKYSQVLQLKRSTFLEILKQYPHDHQRLCYLRDELLFNNAYYELGLTCYTCSAIDHMSIECPLTQLNIGYEAVRQCRQNLIDKSILAQIQSQQNLSQNTTQFQRNVKTCKRLYKQQLSTILLELYYYKTQEKIKQEALSGEHQIIIQSFCLDKIQNFIDYYPQYNFDSIIHKDKFLIFAKQASKRQISSD